MFTLSFSCRSNTYLKEFVGSRLIIVGNCKFIYEETSPDLDNEKIHRTSEVLKASVGLSNHHQ